MLDVMLQILQRDLRLAFRRWSELATPLIFFVIIASLFPLAASPDEAQLRSTGAAVIWMSALLSSLLALDGLFRADSEDGTMEQLILGPAPLGLVVLAKIVAHWIVSGLPLLLLAPLVAMSFYLPVAALPDLIAALALATPTLSVLAAIGAALTVSLRAGGTIIGLLILPLTGPVLIFGTRATELAALGEPLAGPLYLLAALAVLSVSLGPPITAAAVRTALE